MGPSREGREEDKFTELCGGAEDEEGRGESRGRRLEEEDAVRKGRRVEEGDW